MYRCRKCRTAVASAHNILPLDAAHGHRVFRRSARGGRVVAEGGKQGVCGCVGGWRGGYGEGGLLHARGGSGLQIMAEHVAMVTKVFLKAGGGTNDGGGDSGAVLETSNLKPQTPNP